MNVSSALFSVSYENVRVELTNSAAVTKWAKNITNKCFLTSYEKQKLIDQVTFFKLPIVLIVIYVIVAPTLWLYALFFIVIIFNIIWDYMYFKVNYL